MKKMILIVAMAVISATATAQKKTPPPVALADTTVTDSTMILSLKDVQVFDRWLRENITAATYEKIFPAMKEWLQSAVIRRKQQKNK